MLSGRKWAAVAVLLAGLSAGAARADDWSPPQDGALNEKQVSAFIAVEKARRPMVDALADVVEAKGADASATADEYPAKVAGLLQQNGLSQKEYEWIQQQLGQVWSIFYTQAVQRQALGGVEQQVKDADRNAAEERKKLATYQEAQKTGNRVLSAQDRASIVEQAKNDQKSAEDDAKSAGDEAAQHEQDAKAADELAKKPPADVSADDKASYIDGKKKEASDARDAAKEARDREKQAKDKATTAAAKAAHPEVPLTADEKDEAKQEAESAVTEAKSAIEQDDRDKAQYQRMLSQSAASMGEELKKLPKANVDLASKHREELKEVFILQPIDE